jgi:DNA-binding LytR/AlgR family response regulator
LVALSVRDHYVEVQTMAGRGTLLMRFGDAVAEVAPVEGAQVHRSHWVAWDRVARVVREDGRLMLEMAEGPPIPVSRNNRDRLVERGLI